MNCSIQLTVKAQANGGIQCLAQVVSTFTQSALFASRLNKLAVFWLTSRAFHRRDLKFFLIEFFCLSNIS